ncbi:MAG: hypothetical protein J0I93_11960 [Legionella sp.]|nr:hypothetical protein [Legionella sp.]
MNKKSQPQKNSDKHPQDREYTEKKHPTKAEEDKELDKRLQDTFPASDSTAEY